MKYIWAIIFAGILVRLALMPISMHPDLRGHYLGAYIIAVKNDVWGVYDYISKLPREDPIAVLYHDDFLVYSPITYWLHAAWLKVTWPIIPQAQFELFITDIGQAMAGGNMGPLLFILKVPYLLGDLGFLYLLWKIVDKKHRVLAVTLWAINFPVIYSAYLMGQFDIFIVLFIALSIYKMTRGKMTQSAIALALSAGFKPFALFLAPFLPGNKIKNIVTALISYGVIIAPYLMSPGYRQYALLAQHNDKLWYAKILVSGSQYLPLFAVGVGIAFWLAFTKRVVLKNWVWMSIPLFIFYAVVHYHPQWLSWITPFLILAWIEYPQSRWPILAMLGAHLLVIFSFENSLNFGLVGLPYSVNHWLSDQTMSLVRGGLAATCLALPFILFDVPKTTSSEA